MSDCWRGSSLNSFPNYLSLIIYISGEREREEEIQIEAFQPLIYQILSCRGYGAPWGSCASLHLQPRRSRKKTQLPPLVLVWLVPKALTGFMLEKEPSPDSMEPSVLPSTARGLGHLCHPAGT